MAATGGLVSMSLTSVNMNARFAARVLVQPLRAARQELGRLLRQHQALRPAEAVGLAAWASGEARSMIQPKTRLVAARCLRKVNSQTTLSTLAD